MSRSPLRQALTAAVVATSFVSTAPARADVSETTSEAPPEQPASPTEPQHVPAYATYKARRERERRAYGLQTVSVDLMAILGGASLAAATGAAGGAVMVGGYMVGAPIVHVVHGEFVRAVADVGIRFAAPMLLGSLGFIALHRNVSGPEGSSDPGGVAGGWIGLTVGVIAAVVIDASVLAYESDSGGQAMRAAPPRNTLLRPVISPMVSRRIEGGAVYGVSVTVE
jgi:hypothetical protein